MKYEFHVGDYVETVEGKKGYLSRYQVLSDGHIAFYVQYKEEKIYPCDVREDSLKYRFVRIGQYDFTKKAESNIKPLVNSWILESADSKGEYHFDSREVIKKINELVEAVNQLKEKVDGMA